MATLKEKQDKMKQRMLRRSIPTEFEPITEPITEPVKSLPIEVPEERYKAILLSKRIIHKGCWLWTGNRTDGYGIIRIRESKASIRVHVLALYLFERNRFGMSKQVNHRCDVKLCFNPKHLYAGTQADNNRDYQERGKSKMPDPENMIDDVVCGECAFGNLVKNVGLKRCTRCEKAYCIHFACTIAPLEYCVNCLGNLSLTKEIKSVTREKYNPITDQTTRYTRRYRSIHISGDDWLFAQRRIGSLSDPELELSLEFHKEYIQLLAAEQDRRRTEKAHAASSKTAKQSMVLPTGTVSQTVKTSKTTTTTKQNKKVDQIAMLFEQLLDQGKSIAEIQAIIAASKTGK